MTNELTIRVLVADDHPVVREGLSATINYQPDMEVVGKAADGREAAELFRQHRPNVTLMDLRMPEMDGVTAISAIRAEFPAARILALTTYDGAEDIYQSLHAGAAGYVLKETPMEELLEAIRAVHRGKKYVSAETALKMVQHIDDEKLTARELEVLKHIVAGMSNQEIGTALLITQGTVKTHVTHILTKMAVSGRSQAAIAAVKRGLVHLD